MEIIISHCLLGGNSNRGESEETMNLQKLILLLTKGHSAEKLFCFLKIKDFCFLKVKILCCLKTVSVRVEPPILHRESE